MPRILYVPEAGRALSFPDDMTDQQVVDYVIAKYPKAPSAPVPEEDAPGAISSGGYRYLSDLEAAGGAAAGSLGISSLEEYLFRKSKEHEEYAQKYKPSISDVSQIEDIYDLTNYVASQAGQSLIQAGVEGGIGYLIGGRGGPTGMAIGSSVASLPGFVGANLKRQAAEGNMPLEEAELSSAMAAAAAQAPMEYFVDKSIFNMLPGGRTLASVGSPAIEGARALILRNFVKSALDTGIKSALTEPAQQALEIAQANPEKLLEFGPEIQSELLNAAAAGGAVGAVYGGTAGTIGYALSPSPQKIAGEELRADIDAERAATPEMQRSSEVNSALESLAAQPKIGGLVLNKRTIQPAPDDKVGVATDRFQLTDEQGSLIADFSDPVNAVDAVNRYQKQVGKRIPLRNRLTGQALQTDTQIDTVGRTEEIPQPATPAADIPEPPAVEPPSLAVKPISPTVTLESAEPTGVAVKPAIPASLSEAVEPPNLTVKPVGPTAPPAPDLSIRGLDPIPYESSIYDSATKTRTPISGSAPIVDYGNRKIVLKRVNGTKVPFYLSTGSAGKKNVEPGKWYPFFGIGPNDNWINKGTEEEINNFYGSDELRSAAEELNQSIGDIRSDDTIPRVGLSGTHINAINDGLDPTDNAQEDTGDRVSKNVQSILERVRSPVPEDVEQEVRGAKIKSGPGTWSSRDYDVPVEILDAPAETSPDGERFRRVKLDDGTENYVPETQLKSSRPIGAAQAADFSGADQRSFFLRGLAGPTTVSEQEQAAVRQAMADKVEKISSGVRERLNKYGLRDVDAKIASSLSRGLGSKVAFGMETDAEGKSVISLATNIYNPDLTVEEMTDRVFEALDHEAIHSLVSLGLLRQAEFDMLKRAARETPIKGKKYTYLDKANAIYGPLAAENPIYQNPDAILEEAIADMFRDWRLNKLGPPPKVAGLINRIIEVVRSIFNSMRLNTYEDVFTSIEEGAIGARDRGQSLRGVESAGSQRIDVPPNPRMSVAPVYPYGQRVPQVSAKDNNRVIENLEYAAIVTGVERVMKSKTLGYVPDRYKPSKEAVTLFMMRWADKIIPFGQTIDFVRQNGGTVTDAMDFYQNAQLSQSITSEKLKDREDGLYKRLVEYITKSGLDTGKFEQFLYARHAAERNDRIRAITPKKIDKDTGEEVPFDPSYGSGMSYEKARQILSEVSSSPNVNAYLEAERLFRAIIDDTNRLRVEAGLTPDFETMMVENEDGQMVKIEMYKYYAPLRGFADEASVDGETSSESFAKMGQGLKIRGREDPRALGRTSEASDIIAHAMMQNSEAVVRAEKNKVGLSFLELIEANPKLMESYGVKVLEKGKKPLKRVVTSKGIIKSIVDPMYKNRDDVFVVKRNGEEIPILVENRLLQRALIATSSADPAINNKFVKMLGWMNRMLARMNTVYNPEFALVNFPRDLQQAMLNLTQYDIDGVKMKILKDAPSAALGVFRLLKNPEAQSEWKRWYDDFRADGGSTTGFYGTFSIEERLRKIDKMANDVSGSRESRIRKSFESIRDLVENYNGAFENAVRLSVYKNLIETANVSRPKAAFIAKNLTVNFDQRGELGPVMNSLYLFYNASVQGNLALFTAMARSNKVRIALGGLVGFGLVQDLINSLMSEKGEDGEPLYDKIPDYKLENNIILMDPFGITNKGYIAIPLAYGANAFVNAGRVISRSFRGKYTTSQAATSMGFTFVDAFNPVGGTESILNFAFPTVADPVIALSLNLDYSGKKIYPVSFPGAVPKANSQTFFSSTSPTAISIADYLSKWTGGGEFVPGLIEVKPDAIEYVYDYILGATGATARRLFDTATNDLPRVIQGDWSNVEINNIPVFRKLVGNVSERMSFEDYFDKVNHVLLRGEELKDAIKNGDPERVKSVREKYKSELKIYPTIKALSNRRNKIASELRKLRENEKMPPEAKLKRQEFLQKQLEEIINQVDILYGKEIGSKYPDFFS